MSVNLYAPYLKLYFGKKHYQIWFKRYHHFSAAQNSKEIECYYWLYLKIYTSEFGLILLDHITISKKFYSGRTRTLLPSTSISAPSSVAAASVVESSHWSSQLHGDGLPVKLCLVEILNGLLSILFGFKANKRKPVEETHIDDQEFELKNIWIQH